MAKKLTSVSALYDEIRERIAQAVQMTRDEIYSTIDDYIMAWYSDYSPSMYERTYKFADSLIKLDVSINGNNISTEVKIDEGYLGSVYQTGIHPTGMDVAESADSAYHGIVGYNGVQGNIRFWHDAIENMGGEAGIKAMLVSNLKKCGL